MRLVVPPGRPATSVGRISVLMGVSFLDTLGFGLLMPQIPFLALRLDIEPWAIGWVLAVFSIVQIACAPLWGRLSDRRGRRPAILLGLVASLFAYILFGFATSVWILLVSRFVQGLGAGIVGVAQAYVGDVASSEERAKAFGWLSAASSAGIMVGPALGSLATNWSAQAPGFVAAFFCLVNLGFAWRWLPEPGHAKDAEPRERRPLLGLLTQVLTHPTAPVARLIWIYSIGMLGFISLTSVLALYLDLRFAITAANIGYFFLYTGAISVVVRAALLGPLFAKFGETRVLRMGAALLAIGFAALPLPASVWTFTATLTFIPVGAAFLFPATSALVSRLASPQEQGQTLGVQQAFGGVARVIAPIWSTAAFGALGAPVPFRIAAVCLIAAFGLSFGLRHRPQPKQDAEPPSATPTSRPESTAT